MPDQVFEYQYDAGVNKVTFINPRGYKTESVYNDRDLLQTVTRAVGDADTDLFTNQ